MKVVTLLYVFAFVSIHFTYSQVVQPDRFEIEIKTYENYFDVINGEENGLLLVRETDQRDRSGDILFEFIKLDTSLNVDWKRELYINKFLQYRGYDYFDNSFYLLFKTIRGNSRNLEILKMDLVYGDTTHHTVKNLVPIELSEFEMTRDAALIGGYFNYNPFVIHFDINTKKSKVLPGIYQNRSELIQLKVDDESGTFVVVMSERTFDKRNTISVKTYDIEGELIANNQLNPDFDKGLITGSAADFDRNLNLIGGTYSNKRSTYSRGLFVANVDNDGEQEIKYYNYADLNNFFSYMRAKRQKRISNKIERKKIKGKKIRFNYRFIVHDIIENGDQFILLGEAYYPKYSSSSAYTTVYVDTYGYPNTYGMYFVGYRYTHAVVIGFDRDGNILWDNSFEIDDVLSYNLEQFVHADARDDEIVLLYLYDNQIRTKIIEGSEVLEGKSFDQIKLTFQDDVVREDDSEIERLEHWFDRNYYAYGEQHIKNLRDTGVKLNRRVFYVNKVRYK